MQEDFYIKQIIEKRALGPALDILIEAMPRDNLLSSACLELFEFIKKENIKDLVKYLVASHRESLASLSYMTTFRDLILRYDQTQGFTANMDFFLEGDDDMTRKRPPNARLMEHIPVDPTEEEYWNTSDPEDEDEDHRNELPPSTKILPSNGPLTPSKPLVDYPSDEESDENASPESAPTTKTNTDSAEASAASESSSLPTVSPPLERLSEKRRREEDEEDELGKLMQNKRRNSSSSESNSTASPRMTPKRKSFGGVSGNGKISISLSSTAVRTGGGARSEEEP